MRSAATIGSVSTKRDLSVVPCPNGATHPSAYQALNRSHARHSLAPFMHCYRCSQRFSAPHALLRLPSKFGHSAGAPGCHLKRRGRSLAKAKTDQQHEADPNSSGSRNNSDASSKQAHLLTQATQEIRRQQEAGYAPAYDLQSTQRLVETAMLAAVGGVAYTLAVVLKLQSYLGYLQPMPIVVAALRWGPGAARKAMTATFFLLLVLLGPLQALTYVLNQGLMAACLGVCWSRGLPWAVSIPAAAAVRVGGTLAYIGLSSWTMNENLFSLLMTNVYSLLVRCLMDQMSALLGASGVPPPTVVRVVIGSLLAVNAALYVALMHVLYAVLLRAMGYRVAAVPKLVERLVFRQPRTA